MSRDNFNTMDNKGFLWNLLLEAGAFNNIPQEIKCSKETFENKILNR